MCWVLVLVVIFCDFVLFLVILCVGGALDLSSNEEVVSIEISYKK